MHEKTRLAQNSHMNIVYVGIDVLTHLKKNTLPLPLRVARPPPPRTPWTVKKPFRDEHTKKWRYSLEAFFLNDQPPKMTVTFIHFEEKMVQNRQNYQQLLSHWNQPIRRVALVFLWSDWLRDVWILYSVAKSCCPLVVNKIYTQTSAAYTNTDPLWRQTSHTDPLPGHSSHSGGWLPVYVDIYLLS